MSARLVLLIQLLKFTDGFKNRVTNVVSFTNGKPIFRHRSRGVRSVLPKERHVSKNN